MTMAYIGMLLIGYIFSSFVFFHFFIHKILLPLLTRCCDGMLLQIGYLPFHRT